MLAVFRVVYPLALCAQLACSSGDSDGGSSNGGSAGEGGSGGAGGAAGAGGTAGSAGADGRRFLALDNGRNRLLMIGPDGAADWAIDVPLGSRDLQLVDGDQVLVSHGNGAAEYALSDGTQGWTLAGFAGVNSARRLDNGNTLLGANLPGGVTIIEAAPDGAEVSRVELTGLDDMRLLRRLDDGNTLLTVVDPFRVIEVDPAGSVVWEAPLPGKGYVAERLSDGTTVATTGDAVTVLDLDPAGKVIHEVGGKATHPDAGLDWFSGFDRLENGNVVVTNWLGHDKWGTGPHVVELTRDNELVWDWEDHDAARQITNVLVVSE